MKKILFMCLMAMFSFSWTNNTDTNDRTSQERDSIRAKNKQLMLNSCKWIENTIDSIGFIYDNKGGEAFRKAFNNKMINDKYFFRTMLRLGEAAENRRKNQRVSNCVFSSSLYGPGIIGLTESDNGQKGTLRGKRFICTVSNIKEKDWVGKDEFMFSYQIEGICLNTNTQNIVWKEPISITLCAKRWDKEWSEMSVKDKETVKCGDFIVGTKKNTH